MDEKKKKDYWSHGSEGYLSIQKESRKVVLHPRIAELIPQDKPVKILDYGCGDGSFILYLKPECEVALYDINHEALKHAESLLHDYNPKTYFKAASIPDHYFDYAICSLVLMTIPSQKEILKNLYKIHSALHEKGIVIFSITHPCFRNDHFSTFQTEYSKGEEFNYFEEGKKFEVLITDQDTGQRAIFHDYHWTLSTTLRLITESGFTMQQFIELPDFAEGIQFNTLSSPYIIIVCSKM